MSKKTGDKPILLRASRQCLRALHGPEPSQGMHSTLKLHSLNLFNIRSFIVHSAIVSTVAAGQRLYIQLHSVRNHTRARGMCSSGMLP